MWLEIHLQIPSTQAEAVEAVLERVGALSVTLLDAYDDPVLEPAPGTRPLWPHVIAVGLFAAETDPLDLLIALEPALPPEVMAAARFARVDDRDWTRAWMDGYRPMRFGRRLWVVPSGHPDPDQADAVLLRLDPGLAFGSGTHPTTALCLSWLDGLDWNGESLLDFGAGSGILAIAGLKLGAGSAVAIDNDPQALVACADNARRNGVVEHLQILDSAAGVPPCCDRLVANILLSPLLSLAPQLAAAVRPDGEAVFSGLLAEQEGEFCRRYTEWFDDLRVEHSGDWIAVRGRRRSA
ncbi:MAG: 50S ribosomal protein L11 methyltransferase [Xanthomonadales bacterium]|nr:50S ribosomal protein L11 methyltransferase [Xanthomonadales bacterium]